MTTGSTTVNGDGRAGAWGRTTARVLADLAVDPLLGLTSAEVAIRRRRHGPNLLQTTKRRSLLSILADQFRSVVILLLLIAGVLAFLFADIAEGLAIFAVIAINSSIGFLTEWRAGLRARMPQELDAVVVEIVRARVGHLLEREMSVHPRTMGFWNGLVGGIR